MLSSAERVGDHGANAPRRALADAGLPEEVRDYLDGPFSRVAEIFRNTGKSRA